MSHSWITSDDNLTVKYNWKKGRWNSLKVITGKKLSLIKSDSEEEFITEPIGDTQRFQVKRHRNTELNILNGKYIKQRTIQLT